MSSDSRSIIRGNYKHYTVDQKKAAVQLGNEHTFGYASGQLKIPKSTILTWKKNFELGLMGIQKKSGKQLTYDVETDLEIRDWVLQLRDRMLPVTRGDLAEFARRKVNRPDFKASDGWVNHFLQRHDLTLRTKTSVAQYIPSDLKERIDIFHRHITELRMQTDFHHVLNMDETPLFFDFVTNRTINKKGEKSVLIRTTGAEKRHITVALAVTTAGKLLPPLVIFKGKRWPTDITSVPEGMHVEMHEKAWMTQDIMVRWLDSTVAPYTKGRPSLLVMDSFTGHTTASVLDKLNELNVTPAVIPGNCTSKLQPLDVSINKPFKAHAKMHHALYLRNAEVRPDGKVPTASRQAVLGWIEAAWHHMETKERMIQHSFEATGISQALANAVREIAANEDRLMEALLTDDSDEEFLGFTPADVPHFNVDEDCDNPFLE